MSNEKRNAVLTLLATVQKHFNPYFFVAAAVAVLMLTGFTKWTARADGPTLGIIDRAPSQAAVTLEPWRKESFTFTPLANYDLTARVLSKKLYTSDPSAEISPVDLALGWQEMSDARVLEKLDITQEDRWYYVAWRDSLIDRDTIIAHSANTHILPASSEVAATIANVQKDQVVRLRGSLVEVTTTDGFLWKSSLSRLDTGNGSCEVFWVESVEIIAPQSLQASVGTPVIHQH
jgi:hypothetical protein